MLLKLLFFNRILSRIFSNNGATIISCEPKKCLEAKKDSLYSERFVTTGLYILAQVCAMVWPSQNMELSGLFLHEVPLLTTYNAVHYIYTYSKKCVRVNFV